MYLKGKMILVIGNSYEGYDVTFISNCSEVVGGDFGKVQTY